jgi:hypothetical protein
MRRVRCKPIAVDILVRYKEADLWGSSGDPMGSVNVLKANREWSRVEVEIAEPLARAV